MILKNITESVLKIHLLQFQPGEEHIVDSSWYVESVICAIVSGQLQVVGASTVIDQLDTLRGAAVRVIKQPPFGNKEGYNFDGRGVKYVAAPGENELIFTIPEGQYDFTGLKIFHSDHLGDTAHLQVRDTATGLISGASNWLLSQFATDWNVDAKVCGEIMPYTARLLGGMRLVVIYFNSLDTTQDIYINYYLHKVVS